jgi:hypothetical protein
MIACFPVDPDGFVPSTGPARSFSSRGAFADRGVGNALPPLASDLNRDNPPARRDSSGPPSQPVMPSGVMVSLTRFTIRLTFPDGGAPSLIYPVSSRMLVSFLRRGIATYLDVPTVHLLVGDSWDHDLLEHAGTITDRQFPGTGTLCTYLQPGSRVNVYFERPASESPTFPALGGSLSSPLIVADSTEGNDSSEPEDWRATEARYGPEDWRTPEARYGPRYLESATGMRLGDPNPHHPANQDSPPPTPPSPTPPRRRRGTKNGERGRAHPGERDGTGSGEHSDEDLDALLSAQLARDALHSSSSVADLPSSRASPPLSDRESGARKSRRDDLIEGYRRVKRSRILSGPHSHRRPFHLPWHPRLPLHPVPLRLTIFAGRFAPSRHACGPSGLL